MNAIGLYCLFGAMSVDEPKNPVYAIARGDGSSQAMGTNATMSCSCVHISQIVENHVVSIDKNGLLA